MKKDVIKRNIVFILLMGIEGLAFGFLDWESTIADVIYLQHNNKVLISIIAGNIAIAKIIATLICIKLTDSRNPNKIFATCVVLSAIGSLTIGILYQLHFLILFSILYVLEILVVEIYSAYHYAYVYNSLPGQIATQIHSKRISIFKVFFMVGIGIASYLTANYIQNTILLLCIFAAMVFLSLVIFIKRVESFPKNKKEDKIPLREKLNLKRYTSYYKKWLVVRFLGKFALSSLVVLLSMLAIDTNLDVGILKSFKTIAWFFSATGFWFSAYLIKNKVIIKGDIFIKTVIIVLIIISFFYPYAIYAILLLNGLLNPLNTMSNFTMIQRDKDASNVAQKELIINLFGFLAGMLSSYLLLAIPAYIALTIIIILLAISVIKERKLYKEREKEEWKN